MKGIVSMKLSCLTFHDSSNYGAVLQTYALQTFLTSMGHEYEVINYSNAEKRKFDSLTGRNRELSLPLYLYKLAELPLEAYKKQKFQSFSDRYLNKTPRFYTMEELRNYAKNRDAIVVGSDQVWNASMIRQDSAYFLKFTEKRKKLSYAASLGVSKVTDSQRRFYEEMLADFDRIAVREQSGAKLIEEISGKAAEVVLDPTLLLTREDWGKICSPVPDRPYIFAYILRHDPKVQDFLKKLQKQTGLPVRYVTRGYVSALRDGATCVPSPEEWVSQIMNAEYVVTTSFHGTAFSVNFKRTFFTFVDGDITNGTNSRQVDFLRSVGLESRLNPSYPGEICLDAPDFSQVDTVLTRKREEARAYLEKALADVEREALR